MDSASHARHICCCRTRCSRGEAGKPASEESSAPAERRREFQRRKRNRSARRAIRVDANFRDAPARLIWATSARSSFQFPRETSRRIWRAKLMPMAARPAISGCSFAMKMCRSEDELAEAHERLELFYASLVNSADKQWERTHNVAFISDLERRAARELRLEKDWSYEPTMRNECPACGERLKPNVAVCRVCGAVLNREKAAQWGLLRAGSSTVAKYRYRRRQIIPQKQRESSAELNVRKTFIDVHKRKYPDSGRQIHPQSKRTGMKTSLGNSRWNYFCRAILRCRSVGREHSRARFAQGRRGFQRARTATGRRDNSRVHFRRDDHFAVHSART